MKLLFLSKDCKSCKKLLKTISDNGFDASQIHFLHVEFDRSMNQFIIKNAENEIVGTDEDGLPINHLPTYCDTEKEVCLEGFSQIVSELDKICQK